MATQAVHLVIVGSLYVVLSVIVLYTQRENEYDKGMAWVIFGIVHGIDEIIDGVKGWGLFQENVNLWLERVEIGMLYSAGSLLVAITLIKLQLINPKILFKGILPLLSLGFLFFLFLPSKTIESIPIFQIYAGKYSFEVSYVIILFGLLPSIPLALIYISWSIAYMRRWNILSTKTRRDILKNVGIGLSVIIYGISEVLADASAVFLYLELLTIFLVAVTSSELILAGEHGLSLFLWYHVDGMPLLHVKFNTSIPDEDIVLVTGFLSAIQTMVKHELDLGEVDQILTTKGHLLSHRAGEYLFALLATSPNETLKNIFYQTAQSIRSRTLQFEKDPYLVPEEEKRKIEDFVLRNFSLMKISE